MSSVLKHKKKLVLMLNLSKFHQAINLKLKLLIPFVIMYLKKNNRYLNLR